MAVKTKIISYVVYKRIIVIKLWLIACFNRLIKQWKFTEASAREVKSGEIPQASRQNYFLWIFEKINFSNQTPLSDLLLDVKIANSVHWQRPPPWAPSLPQDVTVIRRRKHRHKSTNPTISEGRYFPSSDSWGGRENSEAGVSKQAPQKEVAHSTLPLILAQGSKWKPKQYISFQNKEREGGKKKISFSEYLWFLAGSWCWRGGLLWVLHFILFLHTIHADFSRAARRNHFTSKTLLLSGKKKSYRWFLPFFIWCPLSSLLF